MSETMARIIAGSGTLLCFLLIALKVLWLLWNLLRKREVRIPYIREYKKGSFITNYLVMLLIYFVGILYETRDLLRAFPQAVSSAADFLVLRLKTLT